MTPAWYSKPKLEETLAGRSQGRGETLHATRARARTRRRGRCDQGPTCKGAGLTGCPQLRRRVRQLGTIHSWRKGRPDGEGPSINNVPRVLQGNSYMHGKVGMIPQLNLNLCTVWASRDALLV